MEMWYVYTLFFMNKISVKISKTFTAENQSEFEI